jgi:hypothetical protein
MGCYYNMNLKLFTCLATRKLAEFTYKFAVQLPYYLMNTQNLLQYNASNLPSISLVILLDKPAVLTVEECLVSDSLRIDKHPVLIAMECTEPVAGNGAVVTSHKR